MSKNWNGIGDILKMARDGVSCFETDRFIAVDTEAELEDLAAKLFANQTFFAGNF